MRPCFVVSGGRRTAGSSLHKERSVNTHANQALKITSSADMVAALPILIGRQPHEEVFVVGFGRHVLHDED